MTSVSEWQYQTFRPKHTDYIIIMIIPQTLKCHSLRGDRLNFIFPVVQELQYRYYSVTCLSLQGHHGHLQGTSTRNVRGPRPSGHDEGKKKGQLFSIRHVFSRSVYCKDRPTTESSPLHCSQTTTHHHQIVFLKIASHVSVKKKKKKHCWVSPSHPGVSIHRLEFQPLPSPVRHCQRSSWSCRNEGRVCVFISQFS